MRIQDLTREELELLNTDFGPELEKNAEAYVEEEMSKVAELEQVADDCYNYGAELAMQKIASMEAAHQEKVAMEEKEEKGKKGLSKEKKESPEEEAMEEAEKTASAMGNFTLEGYWDTLMEKGAEYYGDENIYLEELVKEAGMGEFAAKAKKYMGEAYGAAKGKMGKAYSASKDSMKGAYSKAGDKVKKYNNLMKEDFRQSGQSSFSKSHRAKALGKSVARALPYAGAAAGAGYGGKKTYDKYKK